MEAWLEKLVPNVMEKLPELWKCTGQTLRMMGMSGTISFVLGLLVGVMLISTRQGGVLQNTILYNVLDKVINLFRSIPFVILLFSLIPLTRAVAGTALGVKGAVIPLVFGTVPFFSRQVESALAEVDDGLVEAAAAMGSSPVEIIFRVYLKESIPALTRGTTITVISLLGLTAMAGAVAGGGLGDFAIRYGQQRGQTDVTYVTVIILLAIVMFFQTVGNFIIKKTTH